MTDTKYNVPDGHWDDDDPEEPDDNVPVEVGRHTLTVKDESDQIERYNGIEWYFPIEDGKIIACERGHYCPGPAHIDPMGDVRWEDVPERVKRVVLYELRAKDAEEVVDFERVNDMADAYGGGGV